MLRSSTEKLPFKFMKFFGYPKSAINFSVSEQSEERSYVKARKKHSRGRTSRYSRLRHDFKVYWNTAPKIVFDFGCE